MYSVNYWGSVPGTQDDCYTGFDFITLEQAEDWYNESPVGYWIGVAYIELVGPGVEKHRKNPNYKSSKQDDNEWKNEMAWEAGMLHGCEGYNEILGF